MAAAQGVRVDEVGPITAARVLACIGRRAGRPATAPREWQRERPLQVVLAKYAVHTSQMVVDALAQVAAANVHLVYLPAYSPALSRIAPDWHASKQQQVPVRSCEQVVELKRAVDEALARKAYQLRQAYPKTTDVRRSPT